MKKSVCDIVFVFIFFVLLLIPSGFFIKINNNEIPKYEKRPLNKFIPIMTDGRINADFYRDFELWFSDRLNFRNALIRFYSNINYYISVHYRNDSAYIGDDNFAFIKRRSDNAFKLFNKEDYELYSRYIKRLTQYSHKKNIKIYMLVSPSQNIIYADKMHLYKVSEDKFDKLIDYIKEKNNYDILYSKDILLKNKDKFVFYKTDMHWTDYGAYLTYKYFINYIKKDYKGLEVAKENDFKISYSNYAEFIEEGSYPGINLEMLNFFKGENLGVLNVNFEKLLDISYKYYELNNPNIIIKRDKVNKTDVFHNPNGYKKTVLICGSSFSENIKDFFAQTFQDVIKMRLNYPEIEVRRSDLYFDLARIDEFVNKYNPDIVVILFDVPWLEFISEYEKSINEGRVNAI